MKDTMAKSIEKLREIAEPGEARELAPEEALFLDLEAWDTEETLGKEGTDGE